MKARRVKTANNILYIKSFITKTSFKVPRQFGFAYLDWVLLHY